MALGGTLSEGASSQALLSLDDLRDLLRRDHVFFLPEARRLVLPHILPGLPWALSIGKRDGFLDLIIPMQRLHPALELADVAPLMQDINAQLNLPGFYFDRERRQVYFRLTLPWGPRGIDPAELRQWVSAVRQAVREHGSAFEFIDGRPLETCDEETWPGEMDEAGRSSTQQPQDRRTRGDALRRLVQAAPSLRAQHLALKRWLGPSQPGAAR